MGILTRMIDYISPAGLTPPEGVQPVEGFEVERYLGRWFEIVRIDHHFEEGLTRVTADYSAASADEITVINRGYNAETGRWKSAHGIARFVGSPEVASLKVTFFRPFWSGYHVFALDQEHYRWAMVAGKSHDYLWILSREKTLNPDRMERLLEQAETAGFDIRRLTVISHS